MKTRVHYRDPQGQMQFQDVVAPKEDARAVFAHTFPGNRVERVEPVGDPRRAAVSSPFVPAYALTPGDRQISEEDRAAQIAQLKALRAELRRLPAPPSRAGRVGLSMEQRDRGVRPKQ